MGGGNQLTNNCLCKLLRNDAEIVLKLPSNEQAIAIDNSGHLISPGQPHNTLATAESSLSFFWGTS